MTVTPFADPSHFGKATTQNPERNTSTLPKHILVGYWHNWHSNPPAFLPLREVSRHFDVINIAFATASETSSGEINFAPHSGTDPDQFQSDICYLQSLGKKVLISIGGATGSTAVDSVAMKDKFSSSVIKIVQQYGFDGIDINLESKVVLDSGDLDFENPTSGGIKHLIEAIKEIRSNFGSDFALSLAPETVNVQGGFHSYKSFSGSYLPVIHKLRDILTYVQVQHYNSETMVAPDHKSYVPGTVDFHVAMVELLLKGFPIQGNPHHMFPPLKPEQIVVGLATQPHAVNRGYTPPHEVKTVLEYLTNDKSISGNNHLKNPISDGSLRGVMTWSINWDAANHYQFSSMIRSCLDALP